MTSDENKAAVRAQVDQRIAEVDDILGRITQDAGKLTGMDPTDAFAVFAEEVRQELADRPLLLAELLARLALRTSAAGA